MISISYQGEPGAYSEQAAKAFFPKGRCVPLGRFRDVFLSVARGRTRYGIIPIENSVFGSVYENFDLLLRFRLSITGEVKLRIRHQLLALPGVRPKDLRFVYSHPQALGQCETYLHSLKGIKIRAHDDTAGAARMIREEGRTDAAAIAGIHAGKTYGLKILKRNIENHRKNYTRFLLLSKSPVPPRNHGKTTVVFSLRNVPGALFEALAVFALHGINLSKIESRPIQGKPWHYLFYLDIDGSLREKKIAQALNHLKELCTLFRVLGSYPQGKILEG